MMNYKEHISKKHKMVVILQIYLWIICTRSRFLVLQIYKLKRKKSYMYEIYINYNKINSNYKYIIYNIIIIKIYKIISNFGFFVLREGGREPEGGERERKSQADSTPSTEPDMGLDSKILRP